MRNLCKNSPRTRKKSRQRIKCFKQKLWTILRYRKRFFFILAKSQKCGFESQKCLLIIVWSHFLTKIVFLQLSIIKIFYAHENSFFHHIFLSQLANKIFLRKGQASGHPCLSLLIVIRCMITPVTFGPYRHAKVDYNHLW